MILIFSLVIIFLIFINFSISSNKLHILFVYKIFIELKIINNFFLKLMAGFMVFLFLNYNRYIYYSVGLTMHYGYVFIYAISLVFMY